MRRPPCPVDDGAFAVRALQQAYETACLLEAVSAAPDYVLTARALAAATVGLCQAVLTVGVADYEHDVAQEIAGHLGRAQDALARQGSASASLAREEAIRAIGMLHRLDEVDWTMGEMAAAA